MNDALFDNPDWASGYNDQMRRLLNRMPDEKYIGNIFYDCAVRQARFDWTRGVRRVWDPRQGFVSLGKN